MYINLRKQRVVVDIIAIEEDKTSEKNRNSNALQLILGGTCKRCETQYCSKIVNGISYKVHCLHHSTKTEPPVTSEE